MILYLTGHGISVSFVTISSLIAKPTPASLLSPSVWFFVQLYISWKLVVKGIDVPLALASY